MILTWRPVEHGNPQGFVVEIDDGNGGRFTKVYSGNKSRCTVGGLQFDSTYRARVRAYSSAGESLSSDVVYLGTPAGKTRWVSSTYMSHVPTMYSIHGVSSESSIVCIQYFTRCHLSPLLSVFTLFHRSPGGALVSRSRDHGFNFQPESQNVYKSKYKKVGVLPIWIV